MGDESGLIASLRAEGKVAARGHFTLDAEKAREKMRMFQLADPHRWVLLVVQSLVARGAQTIAIEIDTDDLVIVCDARPFEQNELADIHGVILGETAPGPGLRELALGLNAALALNPRWLRIDSSAGGAGVRLEQRPEEPDRIAAIAECEPGVRLHVKERFRPGLLARFFRVGSDALREQVLLRHHCRFAAIEITMNGQRLQDLRRDPDVPRWERVELDGRWVGRVGLATDGSQGRVDVLRHEVWLSAHTFLQPELSGVRAVIDGSDLRTDVSMAEVVRDEAYETLLSAVQRALDPIVTDAVGAFAQGQLPPWLAVHLAARIAVRGLVYPLSPALNAWLAVKLWSTLDGRALSTFDLLGRTLVGFSTERPDEVPQEVGSVIDGRHGAGERLQAILGERCRDRTEAVQHSVQRLLAKRQFESRKHPPGLPEDAAYFDRVEIVGEEGRCGELAFHPLGPERGWLRVVVDGCLLAELPLDLPMKRAHAVIVGRFVPTDLYDDVQRTPTFVEAIYATLVAYDRAVQALAREHAARLDAQGREELCRYVVAMQSDDAALTWLASVGVAAPLAQKLLRERGRPWRLSAGEIVAESDNAIIRVPMFEDAGAVPLDLLAIAEHVRKVGRVRVVAKGRPLLVNAPELVVRTDEKRLKLLTGIFGGRAVERAGKDFDRWVARDEFLGKKKATTLALPQPCRIGPFTLQVFGNEVMIGILDETKSLAMGRSAYISVFAEQRPLCVVRTPCGLSNVQLAIAADPRWVNQKYDGIVAALGNPSIESALVAGLGTLIDGIARSAESANPTELVLELAAMAWPGPTWLDAWHAIGRGRDEDDRDRCYAELLRLGDRHSPDELRGVLRRNLDAGVVPLVDTVAQGLKSKIEPPRNASAQAIAVLERAPRWLELPAFPTCGGARKSLAQLLSWVVAQKRIPYVEAPELGAPPETLLLPTEIADRISAVLGADALQNATPALRLQAQRVQFEQRPQRDGLALPRGEVLVAVEVDHDGITGTLAIPLRMPHEGPGAVTICHRRREVCVVDPLDGTPLVGVLDGDGLGAASGFVALADAELTRIRACCNVYRDDLLRALRRQRIELAAYGGLVDAWARHLLVQLVPHTRASHVALSAAGVAELADMPLFIDSTQQPLTLGMLRAEMDDRGEIGFVTVPGLTLDRMLVLARDNVELAQLRAIFERLTDCEDRARKRAEVQRGLSEAPPLPQPGDDAFIVIDIDERALLGRIWLDRSIDDETGIWLGVDGRAIERRRISKTFPCAGAITGPGVELDHNDGKCVITRQARSMLRSRAAKLYRDLLAELREAMPPADDPRTRVLARLLLRLHATGGATTTDKEQRRCYRDLRELPVLPLPNGRAISLDVALRERPAELAYLGLWQPHETPVDDGGAAPEAVTSDDDSAPLQLPVAPLPPPVVPAMPPEPASVLLPPAPPSREQILVQLVRDELRIIRERDQSLFAEPYLERIRVSLRSGELVAVEEDGNAILDTAHPIVKRALAQPDPLLVSLLASAAFTVLNVAHEALTDEQEARVLAHHAAYLRTAARERTL